MYISQTPAGTYKYQMHYKEERTGKWRKISVTLPKKTEKAKREAEQILNARIREANSDVSAEPATFGEVAAAFMASRSPVWKPQTLKRYKFSIKCLCEALGEDSLVEKLSARYVSRQFLASGKRPTTQNEMLRTFKTVMAWAYRHDYVATIEWLRKLEKAPEPSRKEKNARKYLEKEELQRLLPELKVDLNRYVIEFLALSGLRIGEALALQKEDVDLTARVISVTKTLDPHDSTLTDSAKTFNSNRDVFIQDELLELCRQIKIYTGRAAIACGFRTGFFFSDFDGQPLAYFRLNKYFRENTSRVIGRPLTLHSLRHTHASLMFEAGASLEAVSLRLGHADSKITKEIYLHITQKKKEEYDRQMKEVRLL